MWGGPSCSPRWRARVRARVWIAARLPPAGSGGQGGAALRCAVSRPPGHAVGRASPRRDPARPANTVLGGILQCGGKGRPPKERDEVPGAVGHGGAGTRSTCTDPGHLERWAGAACQRRGGPRLSPLLRGSGQAWCTETRFGDNFQIIGISAQNLLCSFARKGGRGGGGGLGRSCIFSPYSHDTKP